jgi:Ser/Thr protein kinase RdoA (MazF antagonist)
MIARTRDSTGFTLVHGDVNPGNILAPRDGPGPIYLVDRQPFDWSLTTWLGVSDLAYMIVHWWDTELRRRWELPILRHYHEQLERRGIAEYTWDQLMRDYKLAAVQSVYVAVEWCVLEEDRTKMRWVWEPKFQKAMAAFFDLRCAELWAGE